MQMYEHRRCQKFSDVQSAQLLDVLAQNDQKQRISKFRGANFVRHTHKNKGEFTHNAVVCFVAERRAVAAAAGHGAGHVEDGAVVQRYRVAVLRPVAAVHDVVRQAHACSSWRHVIKSRRRRLVMQREQHSAVETKATHRCKTRQLRRSRAQSWRTGRPPCPATVTRKP